MIAHRFIVFSTSLAFNGSREIHLLLLLQCLHRSLSVPADLFDVRQ